MFSYTVCEAQRHADAHTAPHNCLTTALWANPFGSGRILALLRQTGRRMSRHAGAPIVLTPPLTESIDYAGSFIQMSLRCDMPSQIVRWRRGSAWPWVIGRLFAVFGLLWVRRRLRRGVDGSESRAIEEFVCAAAPLVLFALFWALADSPQRPNAWARLA
jgi:hypothetical protein